MAVVGLHHLNREGRCFDSIAYKQAGDVGAVFIVDFAITEARILVDQRVLVQPFAIQTRPRHIFDIDLYAFSRKSPAIIHLRFFRRHARSRRRSKVATEKPFEPAVAARVASLDKLLIHQQGR